LDGKKNKWDVTTVEKANPYDMLCEEKEDNNEDGEEMKNVKLNELTFVSYNVWFGSRKDDLAEYKDRLKALFEIIKEKKT